MVESPGIGLSSNTPPHANVLWTWSVDVAKTFPTLRNKSIWGCWDSNLRPLAQKDSNTMFKNHLNKKNLYQLGLQQRVMHISWNEVPSQNQLVMSGVTHRLMYMFKPFNFINVGQYPLLYSNTPPHVCAANKAQHAHTIFNQMGTVANQDRAIRSDTC